MISKTPEHAFDICIIGAGVVGCAIASEVAPLGLQVVVLDRNDKAGQGTTSRNSEIIHSGIYYAPGSLKARLCVRGRRLIYKIAEKNGVAHRKVGKLVVAVTEAEEELLEQLKKTGEANDVEGLRMVATSELKKMEPEVAAHSALFCSESGIISAHELCDYFCNRATNAGVKFAFRTSVEMLKQNGNGWTVSTTSGTEGARDSESFTFGTRFVVNAAGLDSDLIAEQAGVDVTKAGYRLNWVKGEYFALGSSWRNRIHRLVYPMPEKNLRGLGIHVTLDLAGQVRLGPNTVELSRTEDYSVTKEHQEQFFTAAKRYLPTLRAEDLSPFMAGIRPKLSKAGEPARDFIIADESARGFPGLINLIGIESPGLTSSPAIAIHVREMIEALL